jgi:hypothetical protein
MSALNEDSNSLNGSARSKASRALSSCFRPLTAAGGRSKRRLQPRVTSLVIATEMKRSPISKGVPQPHVSRVIQLGCRRFCTSLTRNRAKRGRQMQRDSTAQRRVEWQKPIIPFERVPPHIRKHLGLRAATRDACACRSVTRDDTAAAITIVMALRHLEARVQALESALNGADRAEDNQQNEPPESKPRDDCEKFGRFDPSVGKATRRVEIATQLRKSRRNSARHFCTKKALKDQRAKLCA